MAGLNYANKNPSSTFTNKDLFQGYCASVSASILTAISLRKLTGGLTQKATGPRLMILNTMVAAVASSSAGYVNTTLMRQPEAKSGIKVYSSKSMKESECLGVSQTCAKKAITETALSRVALSSLCCSLPIIILTPIERASIIQRMLIRSGQPGRQLLNFSAIVLSIYIGLPAAVSIFEPISSIQADACEPEIRNKKHDGIIYFSKGL